VKDTITPKNIAKAELSKMLDDIWIKYRKEWVANGARGALESIYQKIAADVANGKTNEELRDHIRETVKEIGTVNWCRDNGITVNYLYQVLSGRKPITDRISRLARYKRTITFVRMDDDE